MKLFILKASIGVVLTITLVASLNGQISPGELAKAHAHLEGLSNCTQCHSLGNKVTDEKCLVCHKEIATLQSQNRGYHVSSEVKAKKCFECHNDHHGRNFQIIRFEPEKFDHTLSGYKLSGAHARINCKDCHKADFIGDQKLKKKENTYLGLEPACLKCHDDYHQNTLPANCNDCHDFEKFKPAPGFNHTNAEFILKGKHKEVECIKCHKVTEKNGRTFQEFKGVKFANCSNCHEDVHKNKFGSDCKQCHTEESFQIIRDVAGFNHNQTAFPLEGKHIGVGCKDCHKTKYTNPVKHNACIDCHDDYHKGQFTTAGKRVDCVACHTVQGFQGSTFTIERHAETIFPLTGAHIATPCFDCHFEDKQWSFRNIGINCIDCHEDIHDTYIEKYYYPGSECSKCHETSRWPHVAFDHSLTGFNLEGVHTKQTCRSCHFRVTEGKIIQQFNTLTSDCIQCHDDIHYNQFDEDGKTQCLKCHGFEDWKAEKFDHNTTRFILDGKHILVPCRKCHFEVIEENKIYIKYKTERLLCKDCH